MRNQIEHVKSLIARRDAQGRPQAMPEPKADPTLANFIARLNAKRRALGIII